MHDHVRYCVLMSLVVVHIISATSEVISVKALNYDADVRLPIYFALMVNAYWIVWAPLYFAGRACKFPKHRMSWQRVRSYCLIAAVGTPVTLLRMHGLNSIPGTVYVVISTADLVFSALLQKLMFPERRMTMFHSLAIVLCCGAIVLVALGSEESTTFVCDGDSCLDDYAVGIFAGLGSAFLNACQIALADKLLEDKPEKGVRLQQPSANGRHGSASVLRVSEMMLFNGLIGSLILPVLLLFSGEATAWGDTFESVSNQGLGSLLVTLSLVLCFGKLLDRVRLRVLHPRDHRLTHHCADSLRSIKLLPSRRPSFLCWLTPCGG